MDGRGVGWDRRSGAVPLVWRLADAGDRGPALPGVSLVVSGLLTAAPESARRRAIR